MSLEWNFAVIGRWGIRRLRGAERWVEGEVGHYERLIDLVIYACLHDSIVLILAS